MGLFRSGFGPKLRALLNFWPYALVACCYLLTTPYHAGLNNPNEMVRLYMSAAWIDHHSFDIDPEIRRWGGVDDKAVRDGKLYSSKAPLQSLIGVPAYAISQPLLRALGVAPTKRTILMVVRWLGSAIFGIGLSWLFLFWARRRAPELGATKAAGTGVGLALALGTMTFPYAITFTGHVLAALTAGGAYLGAVGLARAPAGSGRWRGYAVLAGLAAGATPFAEYPAALVAGPALLVAFWSAPNWRRRAELLGLFALGGALPFGLGLWSHQVLWGSPFKTGYAFLENKGYVQVHGQGFFGVTLPKPIPLLGALFSPGTGLFFFSPVLMVALVPLLRTTFGPKSPEAGRDHRLPRALAVAGLIAFVLECLFIAGHRGWRGGWTVGPRYIIAVVPLLGVWLVEALAYPRLRSFIAGLGVVSIGTTGFAAALYPHLSDVFTNPLWTFLAPSYARGEMSYGLGHALGLSGHAANLVHVVPLVLAMLYVGLAGADLDPSRLLRLAGLPVLQRSIFVATMLVIAGTIIAFIPEEDPAAAERENERLWGFWEPRTPKPPPEVPPGFLSRARDAYREVSITATLPDGTTRQCRPHQLGPCQYGPEPWQHFGPEHLDFNGKSEPILFLHPIAQHSVTAQIPLRPGAARLVFRYGLADASVAADNPFPLQLTLRQGGRILDALKVGKEPGLHRLELSTTSTAPFELELRVERDGARVFGFDLEQYR